MNFLFLCTHNRCPSILAEAVARQVLGGDASVASAGSQPARKVHPLTLEHLAMHDIPVRGLRAKSLEMLNNFSPDFVVTVCDNAADDSCPVLQGAARKIHWDLPDPSVLGDDKDSCDESFARVIATLTFRMNRLKGLLHQGVSTDAVEREMNALSNSFIDVAATAG
jgi:arsenate reductase (thioredoxin)